MSKTRPNMAVTISQETQYSFVPYSPYKLQVIITHADKINPVVFLTNIVTAVTKITNEKDIGLILGSWMAYFHDYRRSPPNKEAFKKVLQEIANANPSITSVINKNINTLTRKIDNYYPATMRSGKRPSDDVLLSAVKVSQAFIDHQGGCTLLDDGQVTALSVEIGGSPFYEHTAALCFYTLYLRNTGKFTRISVTSNINIIKDAIDEANKFFATSAAVKAIEDSYPYNNMLAAKPHRTPQPVEEIKHTNLAQTSITTTSNSSQGSTNNELPYNARFIYQLETAGSEQKSSSSTITIAALAAQNQKDQAKGKLSNPVATIQNNNITSQPLPSAPMNALAKVPAKQNNPLPTQNNVPFDEAPPSFEEAIKEPPLQLLCVTSPFSNPKM